MEVVQYIRFTKPGEKSRLYNLFDKCNTEMELRRAIVSEFEVSNIDASIIMSRFKNDFIKKLKQRNLC